MKILVVNAGSSSLKFQLINMENEEVIAKGNVERINDTGSFLNYKANGKSEKFEREIKNHIEAMDIVIEKLTDKEVGVIESVDEIGAFGHRVVNVGDEYFDSCVVTKEVLEDFKTKTDFSPLHVPGAIAGIEAVMNICPEKTNVAVFDIGFHKTLKPEAYLYAIPKRYYDEYKIRRYGAHGTSHFYVAHECAKYMGKDIKDLKIITCHLGGGASITAVQNGESIDTSMGFTPLEGIMMNTRSGDLDPAVIEYICNKEGKTASEVIKMLNKESGLLGVNGKVSDMRDITENLDDPDIKLSFDMYTRRVKKYIGAYTALMDGVDAIVFTAGIGENTPELRHDVAETLNYLGVKIDDTKNNNIPRGTFADITAEGSKVKVLVIPTDEEMVIARQTKEIVEK